MGELWIFKKCQDKRSVKIERASKPFLKPRSSAFMVSLVKEKMLVKEKSLLNDLKYLTTLNQTGTLEVYHSLYNKCCPQPLHFSNEDVITLPQLAVLDFNAYAGFKQTETKLWEIRFKQQFSKVTQSKVAK